MREGGADPRAIAAQQPAPAQLADETLQLGQRLLALQQQHGQLGGAVGDVARQPRQLRRGALDVGHHRLQRVQRRHRAVGDLRDGGGLLAQPLAHQRRVARHALHLLQDGAELGHGLVGAPEHRLQLVDERRVGDELAERALAAVDALRDGAQAGQEVAQVALGALYRLGHVGDGTDGRVRLVEDGQQAFADVADELLDGLRGDALAARLQHGVLEVQRLAAAPGDLQVGVAGDAEAPLDEGLRVPAQEGLHLALQVDQRVHGLAGLDDDVADLAGAGAEYLHGRALGQAVEPLRRHQHLHRDAGVEPLLHAPRLARGEHEQRHGDQHQRAHGLARVAPQRVQVGAHAAASAGSRARPATRSRRLTGMERSHQSFSDSVIHSTAPPRSQTARTSAISGASTSG